MSDTSKFRDNLADDVSGVRVNDVFWSWDKPVDALSIEHERLLKKARYLEGVLAFLFSALFFVLGILLLISLQESAAVTLDLLWTTPSPFVFCFSLSFLAFAFGLHRRIKDRVVTRNLPSGKGELASESGSSSRMNIAETFLPEAVQVVEDAFLLAEKTESLHVSPLHLFAAALAVPSGQIFLARLGVSLQDVKAPLQRKLHEEEKGPTTFSVKGERLLAEAFLGALDGRSRSVSAMDVLKAATFAEDFFIELFEERGVTRDDLENVFVWMRIQDELSLRYKRLRTAAAGKPTGNMDRAMTAVATPFLDAVSEDLTRNAVYGRTALLVEREGEMNAVFRAIEGGGSSVVLVGQPGVGKGAMIEGIADLMVEERVPKILQDKRLLKLSVPHIVSAEAGAGAEERLLYALEQAARAGNVVLVIEDVHELVASSGKGVDLAAVLSSELEKGYTFVIATTTPEGYTRTLEHSVLQSKLARVTIEEPKLDTAIRILESKIGGIEARNHVIFTYPALRAVVELSSRYITDAVLPQKAIELAQEVALIAGKKSEKITWVKKEDVAALVAEKTKIPVTEVTRNEGQKLLHLEESLHERVIGQEVAVKAISAALRRARAEVRSEGKPIASFLFLGPTGVGKTELAKATAAVFFGSEKSMIRFDMSEYQNKDSVTRLIGGNGEVGLLTEAVRKTPFALLLLDELEKAHPDILNLFLQVMDDGRLTDGTGRTIDFTNVILIATSNAGTQYIEDEVRKGTDLVMIKDALLNTELRQLYRPEFLNRFTEVIVFAPLTEADVTAIAYLILAKVKDRLDAKMITLEVTDAAVHELAKAGYDPKFGARPLKRVIEERVENVLADEMLKGNIARRDSVFFDVQGKFEVKKAQKL